MQDPVKAAAARGRSFLADQITTRAGLAGRQVSSAAQDLRRISRELRRTPTTSAAADLADRGADIVARVGSYLENNDADQLIADAEDFARARPWAVATGALALGFAASRFVKASSARRYAGTSASGYYGDDED